MALLVPAGGIAYLGAVSYRDQKGAVAAQLDRQRGAAVAIVGRIDRAIVAALDDADRAATAGQSSPLPGLARYWFWLAADGHIRVPKTALPLVVPDPALDRPASPSGRIEDYVRELSRRQDRAARLRAAQRAEACNDGACVAALAEARRGYAALVAFDDTGPDALLGLARVVARLGDPQRSLALLDELDRRFGTRSFPKGGASPERVPVVLVTAMLRAEAAGAARASRLLAVAQAVLAGAYEIDPIVGIGVVTRVRAELAGAVPAGAPAGDPAGVPAGVKAQLQALDVEVETLRARARAAAGLADDKDELVTTATTAWRGKPAVKQPGRTLIYRRRADGSVIGLAVDGRMLAAAAGHDPSDDVAREARPLVLATGASPGAELRKLDQLPLGEQQPHLQLWLVNPVVAPDPLDEVVRHRERTHIVFTSALALMLGVGLLAMIRGAARARELAQLKSDFVSTVSHELKTPLTSIRMFAEMLQQGVAQGDAEKMHRYHGVIVQESQRLGLLIANLLDYAQIERGTRRYTQTSVELAQLGQLAVSTFEALASPQAGRNPIAIDVSPAAMTTEVEVDGDVVVGAVLNLLANAAKYGGIGKPIEVRIDADATGASIAVRDHGPGIPPAEQARIFREFYRAPEAYRSNVEGTGLGLALVKRHIEALGGTVAVVSEVGRGATFTIRLPRAPISPMPPEVTP
ncbi:MAG: HAMP domain-containing sensor histidine kinase [Kofleriaceae bacterium]